MKTLMRKVALILVLVCIFAMVLPVSAAEERIDLYKSGGGDGPKNVLAVGDIAVKFTVPEGKMLKAFVFIDSPTWTKNDSTGEIVLFKWDTDYATTVAGDRLESHSELHADNSDFRLDVNGYYGPGTYLVLMPRMLRQTILAFGPMVKIRCRSCYLYKWYRAKLHGKVVHICSR